MRTHTENAITVLVAVAGSDVRLGRRTAVEHVVDGGHGVDVHKANLMANTVVRQVDESHLPALGVFAGNVEQTYLCTVERIGIVDGT